jgi:hypothetical protein
MIAVISPGEGRRTNFTSPPLFSIFVISCSPCSGSIIQFHPASASKSGKPLAITHGPSMMERKAGPSERMTSCHVAATHSKDRHLRSIASGFCPTYRVSSRKACGDASMEHLTNVEAMNMGVFRVSSMSLRRLSGYQIRAGLGKVSRSA